MREHSGNYEENHYLIIKHLLNMHAQHVYKMVVKSFFLILCLLHKYIISWNRFFEKYDQFVWQNPYKHDNLFKKSVLKLPIIIAFYRRLSSEEEAYRYVNIPDGWWLMEILYSSFSFAYITYVHKSLQEQTGDPHILLECKNNKHASISLFTFTDRLLCRIFAGHKTAI